MQRCAVNGVLSNICPLTCEIPLDTILGPLLFLLYINDLPNCIANSQPRMYEDNTHLTYAENDIYTIEASLNQHLSNINGCFNANKLTPNMTKTEFMLIAPRQKLNSLSVPPGLEINRVFRFSGFKKEIAERFFCSFVHFKLLYEFQS